MYHFSLSPLPRRVLCKAIKRVHCHSCWELLTPPEVRRFYIMVSTRKRQSPVAPVELPADDDDNDSSSPPSPPIKRTKRANSVTATAVDELFQASGIVKTTTKDGWCLQEGMTRLLEADPSGQLLLIVQKKGLPAIYSIVEDAATCRHETTTTITDTKPQDCFQSLCRIIAGQQLAGAAARAMWHRLIKVAASTADSVTDSSPTSTDSDDDPKELTPEVILFLAAKGFEEYLRKPAGLSNAKGRSIVALAQAYAGGDLTEDFLTSPTSTEEDIRAKLLLIKGIGPWTCDMFLMFYLEKGNVLPVGDLGVRKGIAKFFGLKGKGYKGSLCNIKDKEVMVRVMAPYQPYQSLISYYMWAVADTKDFYRDSSNKEGGEANTTTPSKSKGKRTKDAAVVTP